MQSYSVQELDIARAAALLNKLSLDKAVAVLGALPQAMAHKLLAASLLANPVGLLLTGDEASGRQMLSHFSVEESVALLKVRTGFPFGSWHCIECPLQQPGCLLAKCCGLQ